MHKSLLPYYIEESKLFHESWKLRNSNPKKSRELTEEFNNLRFYTVAPLRTEWAKKHLDYELTPRYFLESHIPRDTVVKYNSLLSIASKNSKYGKILNGIVSGWSNTNIGKIAPTFSQHTYKGNVFSLEEKKGKYVILDFWGSWCAPCLYGMPKMKKYYDKYHGQIEFVGIACNDKKENWEKAIIDNQLNWTQLLNNKSTKDLSVLYGVTNYPSKFIIDKQGRIVAKFFGESKDFYSKIDEIMN